MAGLRSGEAPISSAGQDLGSDSARSGVSSGPQRRYPSRFGARSSTGCDQRVPGSVQWMEGLRGDHEAIRPVAPVDLLERRPPDRDERTDPFMVWLRAKHACHVLVRRLHLFTNVRAKVDTTHRYG